MAKVQARQGAPDEARTALRRGRDIIAELARRSPSDAGLPRDLAWFDGRIAELGK